MDNSIRHNLTVIDGGLRDDASTSRKVFRIAYATDTRLMGVVAVHAIWDLPDNKIRTEMHQFFYFDAEEFGFDTYESVFSSGADDDYANFKISLIANRLMGGLGAKLVTITERELRYLTQKYVRMTCDIGDDLPENYNEYKYLLRPVIKFAADEEAALMSKICTEIKSPYQAINYFIMRNAGRDFEAAKFLTGRYVRTDIFREHEAAALLRNVIKDMPDENGSNSSYRKVDSVGSFVTVKNFFCESLIEYNDRYFILTSEVSLEGLKIVGYKRLSSFRISATEVDMMTQTAEHVTLFDLDCDPDEFSVTATELTQKAMCTDHDSGKLFMIFHPDNAHVAKPVFKLSDDLIGIYYVTNFGQIVVSSYNEDAIRLLENDLLKSRFKEALTPLAKYSFPTPVVYDFVNSGYEDFEEFVEDISDTSDE